MPNKVYAKEWIELARHNLQGAEILFAADHFTDVIGCEIQIPAIHFHRAMK